MDKLESYRCLNELRNNGIDISECLREVVSCSSSEMPMSVVLFIDKHSPRESLNIIRDIHERKDKNPLYKTLVNESISVNEKAIALSSFLTRVTIHSNSLSKFKALSCCEELYCEDICNALNSYSKRSAGCESKINESFDKLRCIIKKVYPDKR